MSRFGLVSIAQVAKAARSDWDRAIARIAERQQGVISHGQLLAIGLSPSAISARKRRGVLIPIFRGVYAVGYPPGAYGRWMAAVLACGTGSVISHATAAALWGIRRSSSRLVHVTVPTRAGRGRDGLRVHRADLLLPSQLTDHRGIPCTTVARTIVDLAGTVAEASLEYAIHQAQTKRLFSRREVLEALDAAPTRRGTAVVRRVLGISRPDEDEINRELARRFLRICRQAGIPEPLTDHWVALPDGDGYEVDFCWPEQRLIIETDGRRVHDTHRGFENDRRRDRRLRLAGWQVARFTWRDVTERPTNVVAEVRGLLVVAARSAAAR
jgi:predicted transcriptional regulator of viral defense system